VNITVYVDLQTDLIPMGYTDKDKKNLTFVFCLGFLIYGMCQKVISFRVIQLCPPFLFIYFNTFKNNRTQKYSIQVSG
jgi:hypothetical protein